MRRKGGENGSIEVSCLEKRKTRVDVDSALLFLSTLKMEVSRINITLVLLIHTMVQMRFSQVIINFPPFFFFLISLIINFLSVLNFYGVDLSP